MFPTQLPQDIFLRSEMRVGRLCGWVHHRLLPPTARRALATTPGDGMDPLTKEASERLASAAQAGPSPLQSTRVAVAQMTSGSSPEANFDTCARLAEVTRP